MFMCMFFIMPMPISIPAIADAFVLWPMSTAMVECEWEPMSIAIDMEDGIDIDIDIGISIDIPECIDIDIDIEDGIDIDIDPILPDDVDIDIDIDIMDDIMDDIIEDIEDKEDIEDIALYFIILICRSGEICWSKVLFVAYNQASFFFFDRSQEYNSLIYMSFLGANKIFF